VAIHFRRIPLCRPPLPLLPHPTPPQFAPRKAGKRKLEQSGKSMMELKAQQAALFERSRARLQQQISSGALQPQTPAQTHAPLAAASAPGPAAL